MRSLRSRKGFIVALVTLAIALAPVAVSAQGFVDRIQEGVQQAGEPSGFSSDGPGVVDIVGNIISVALTFVGVILLVLILYAGFLWMTAGGNEEKVKEARGIIRNAIIGLIITVSAYAIADYVLARITEAQSGEGLDTTLRLIRDSIG